MIHNDMSRVSLKKSGCLHYIHIGLHEDDELSAYSRLL